MNDAERFQAPIHSYPVSRDKPALFTLLPAPSHATPRAPPSLPPLSFVSPLGSTNASTSPATAHDTTRNVTYAGTVANDVEQFPSIPYGQPTSGTRRFANPVPASLADGSVVDATSDGDACPQPDAEASGFGANVRRSEDCLRLNVARPVGTKEGDELPVVVADDYALLRAVSRCWSTFAWYVTPSVEGKDTLAGWTPACARGGNETDLFVIGAPEEGLSAVEGKNAKTVVAEQRLCERCGFLNSEEVVRELLY
ncbi:Alpha/Beta hydrolase protein [Phyllosticta paracitricarpa]